uniref:Lactoylglutathione lyase n=1 Tax=Eutreptiella gymnastica TaxID=73025 RepID=A0A7S1NJ34_9EUGL|mmetsp:Transcript_43166/g.77605  ORF Transcript_43166/g.77605 Transcript_43166/m.77605 type:complete len:314 (+) Transcript_43166:21-962(+)
MAVNTLNWSWQQTMLRVKDKIDFPDMNFSLYFLTTLPHDQPYTLEPGTDEAHKFLWTFSGVTLELTHNWGTETQEDFKYHPGNQEKDGFGHIAVNCDDVYARCAELEAKGVTFKKKPDEGRMKGLAFAYDPDGYWVEIIPRGDGHSIKIPYNFSQTMLRVKDPKKTVPFYEALGMTLIRETHFDDFSLYFLATLPKGTEVPDPKSPEGRQYCKCLFPPVLELTHNHGTETQEDFQHNNGNVEPTKGFGHIGFLVDNVDAACAELEALGAGFVKKPTDGKMKGLAFAKDPDGYWVEIVKRGGYDAAATPFWLEA